MNQTATISSKRQFTIPVKMFNALNLREGEKVVVSQQDDALLIEPMSALIDRLGGSVKKPARLKRVDDPDTLIREARRKYFRAKK